METCEGPKSYHFVEKNVVTNKHIQFQKLKLNKMLKII